MKKFSVKDFIVHNGPCFSCDKPISLELFVHDQYQITNLFCQVQTDFTAVDLLFSYKDTLKLTINHKTNQFETNNLEGLKKYLSTRHLSLTCRCSSCNTEMKSHYLDFDLDKKFIKAVSIEEEIILVEDEKSFYQVYSHYDDNHSAIFISDKREFATNMLFRLDTPLIPRAKFKNRKELIQKLKTFVLFS